MRQDPRSTATASWTGFARRMAPWLGLAWAFAVLQGCGASALETHVRAAHATQLALERTEVVIAESRLAALEFAARDPSSTIEHAEAEVERLRARWAIPVALHNAAAEAHGAWVAALIATDDSDGWLSFAVRCARALKTALDGLRSFGVTGLELPAELGALLE